MRVSKLYLKIFLAFLAVLIAAESAVFIFVLSGRPPSPFIRTVVGETVMADRLIRKELAEAPAGANAAARLGPVMRILDREHRRLWVSDANGATLAASFDGRPPVMDMALDPVELAEGEPVRMFKAEGRHFKAIYLESDIIAPGGAPLLLHVLIDRPHHNEETWFLKGLLLLTVLGALFILPVALRIIRPVRKLAEAADRLGHGDFSQRVPVTGRDEVADLANKFNNMAGRLQKLVLSGRELTAQLSHELRTPLARMRISLQMAMERGAEGGADRRYLDKIGDEIENMDRIIGSILDLSKLDMQEAPPRTDRVDVSARLAELLETYGPMVERHGFALTAELGATPALRCNAHALDVLLNNILANAMKYTDEGGAIEVRALAGTEGLVVEVANAHPPLSDKDLADMFTPFHRLYRGKEAGTGLGLTTARRMAEMHGGTIESSWADGRVRIRVELPLG
ncbi:HAMP domain-containing sensor histidine kinase [Pseudodesulfovibrio sp.]|uniref:sensor histidine kinase n=1 Tax=Pseudodesulfovibrio sp. TaxID=2035812 RepID=UPI00262A900C|nr:HAMP domain-containing sensor histidine kinase [Pseudodesulfovibrio sp.]MDD3311157.1 HAMP domain-containing sensor histidine kinase [Pseudodesulfovibrio sp.]